MIRIVAAGALVAGLSCASAACAQSLPYLVLGNGQNSCGEFLTGSPQQQQLDAAWALGFITGVNFVAPAGKRLVGQSYRDSEAVIAWLQQYCRTHALEQFSSAAAALYDEYAKREGRQ